MQALRNVAELEENTVYVTFTLMETKAYETSLKNLTKLLESNANATSTANFTAMWSRTELE